MVRAIVQGDLHVHNGVAGQNTGLHRALNTGIDGGDILLGDGAANNGVDELVTLAGLVGLHMDLDVTVLALTAGLTGVLGLLDPQPCGWSPCRKPEEHPRSPRP